MMKSKFIKIERLLVRSHKTWVEWRGTSGQIYFEHRVSEYQKMWRSIADDLGARFSILADNFWELELDGKCIRINNYQLEFDNPVTLSLAGNKPLVHRLLMEGNIPIPKHIVFRLSELGKAYGFLESNSGYCVIKPADGYGGKGVSTHIKSTREVDRAAILASLYSHNLLMESQVPGESYRLLVLGGKLVHAVCRQGPRLVGDGNSTVSELLERENRRLQNQGKNGFDLDRDCEFTLRYQGLEIDSTPEKGREIIIKSINEPERNNQEVRTVYNKVVTHLICERVKEQVELAAKIVKSDFVGVDIITVNPQVPLEDSGGVVNEVNTTPALHHHYDINTEKYPLVAMQAASFLLDRGLGAEGERGCSS